VMAGMVVEYDERIDVPDLLEMSGGFHAFLRRAGSAIHFAEHEVIGTDHGHHVSEHVAAHDGVHG